MPRALVVCEHPTLNGGERSLLAVVPTLQSAGWELDFFCPPHGPLADALAERRLNVVPAPPQDRSMALAAALAACRYDLLHANSLAMGRICGPIAAERRLPSIAHLRDIVRLGPRAIADLNRHARLIAVSEATRRFHIAQGLDAARTFVVRNGVDGREFRPGDESVSLAAENDLRRELGLPSCVRPVGMIGQIILRKGQDVALAALERVMRDRFDVYAIVVGARHSEKPETIEFERRLHAIVAAAGLQARVRFLGTRNDVVRLLPQLTLLLHAARQEPLGRVLLEAAACGVPIVATDVGGTREIFPRTDDNGARLVAADDAAAMERAAAAVLDDEPLRRRMSAAGRRRMLTAFSVEQSGRELLRHYTKAAAE